MKPIEILTLLSQGYSRERIEEIVKEREDKKMERGIINWKGKKYKRINPWNK